MTQDISRKYPILWNLNERNQVVGQEEEDKLSAAVQFILENYTWVQDNTGEPLAFALCKRLFKTIPPASMQDTMDVAKQIIIQTVKTQDLLLAILPQHLPVIEVENPITKSTQLFIKINLTNWTDADIESIKTAVSSFPDLGISVTGQQNLNRLERLSKAIPELKAFHCPGICLSLLPLAWQDKLEWLYCFMALQVNEPNCYLNLKGLIAPVATSIVLDSCMALDEIHAPQLKVLEISNAWKFPSVVADDLQSVTLKNCKPITHIETNALKLTCTSHEDLESIVAPRALEIECPDSDQVKRLYAASARKVLLKGYTQLGDMDLRTDAVLNTPTSKASLTKQSPFATTPMLPIEEYLHKDLPERFQIVVRHNSVTSQNQHFIYIRSIDNDLSAEELRWLQNAFFHYPDLGLMLRNHFFTARVRGLELEIPRLKALCIQGVYLEVLPDVWKRSVEWLYCLGVDWLIVPELPGLKGLFAPNATKIECDKASMEVIDAPNLKIAEFKRTQRKPIIRSEGHVSVTSDEEKVTPHAPVLWELGASIGDKLSVYGIDGEVKLESSLLLILNDDKWIDRNLHTPEGLKFAAHLFATHPPDRMEGIMTSVKERILERMRPLFLLIAMFPEGYQLITRMNHQTKMEHAFLQVNLGRYQATDNELLQRIFTSDPKLGIGFVGQQQMEKLEGLAKIAPDIKAIRCPGIELDAIPAPWKASVEWLTCTIMPVISSSSAFPNLKGLVAPMATQIDLKKCPALKYINAPLLQKPL